MHCWARYLFLAVVAALAVGQLLAACGQKGDLYLPRPGDTAAAKPDPGAKPDQGTKAATPQSPAAAPQPQAQPETPPPPQPHGTGEGLEVLDAVPSTTPDPSGL